MKCELSPARNGLAYAGSIAGRELVYERSRVPLQADPHRDDSTLRKSGRR